MKINVAGAGLFLLVGCALSGAQAFDGQVVEVMSGDLILVSESNAANSVVRLACIDAPEDGQAGAKEAASFLRAKALGKQVRVDVIDRDSRGRLLGNVFVDGSWLSREMILSGHAWALAGGDCGELLSKAQNEAMSNQSGLWAEGQPIAPWDFRHETASRTSFTLDEYVRYRLREPDVYDQLRTDGVAAADRGDGIPVPASWLAGATELNRESVAQAAVEKQRREAEAARDRLAKQTAARSAPPPSPIVRSLSPYRPPVAAPRTSGSGQVSPPGTHTIVVGGGGAIITYRTIVVH
jgi:endonuclease YncB( thermonuclease family)